MTWQPLVGLLALVYAGFVVYVAATKVPSIWNMRKIEGFKRVLGEKGTVIFFYIWAVLFAIVGILLFTVWS